jgi:hypothetical protein
MNCNGLFCECPSLYECPSLCEESTMLTMDPKGLVYFTSILVDSPALDCYKKAQRLKYSSEGSGEKFACKLWIIN